MVEYTISEKEIERVGTLRLVRALDLDKLASESKDGKVDVEVLQTAGDYVVILTPNGRNAKATRFKCVDEEDGVSFIRGFNAAIDSKKKPRKEKPNGATKAKANKNKTTAKNATA